MRYYFIKMNMKYIKFWIENYEFLLEFVSSVSFLTHSFSMRKNFWGPVILIEQITKKNFLIIFKKGETENKPFRTRTM